MMCLYEISASVVYKSKLSTATMLIATNICRGRTRFVD